MTTRRKADYVRGARKGYKKSLVAVSIRFIDHICQRYPTVGDWFWRHTTLHIRVSDMRDDRFNMLVAVHEYIEALLCWKANISESDVTKFDLDFEDKRSRHELLGGVKEPGDHPDAPYFKQHQIATNVERFLADQLGIDWEEYDAAVNKL